MPASLTSISKNVTTAGTRVALVASTLEVYEFEVQAKTTNTGLIYLGGADVASTNGRVLSAGQSFAVSGMLDINDKSPNDKINLGAVYIDSSVNGEGVIVSYIVR